MKAKELIEVLKEYPDFEVELTYLANLASDDVWPMYRRMSVGGIRIIEHIDKVIALDVSMKEGEVCDNRI